MSNKSALVLLAEGSEEMEFTITVDVLRRAEVKVTVAGLTSPDVITCSRGVFIKPDASLSDAVSGGKQYDIVILPGGIKGAQSFADSAEVGKILKSHQEGDRFIGAICAAPALAFPAHKIAEGKSVTSYPALKDKLASGYKYSEDRVVVDGKVITSRGPGTSFEFALAIVSQLCGAEKISQLKQQMLVQ